MPGTWYTSTQVLLCVFCISRHHLFGGLLLVLEPHRLSWAELREDLHRRKAFRRTARMSEGKLVTFAHLLRPAFQKNERQKIPRTTYLVPDIRVPGTNAVYLVRVLRF